MSNQEPTLQSADADGVRTLTLNRPQRRNALDTPLAEALLTALRRADQDDSVGAVLIASTGPVFSAGADLGEFKGAHENAEAEERRSDIFMELQLVFDEIQVPVVCAVAGAAIGAGASIAIAADITVMGETARLAYPEIAHGMVPGLMIATLQRRTGRKKAFELLAAGEPVGAHEALALGLANRVVPDAQVLEAATALARTLAGRNRTALRETKRLFVGQTEQPVREGLVAARASGRARRSRARGGAAT